MAPDFKSYITIPMVLLIAVTVLVRLPVWDINEGYWWDEAVYLGLGKNIAEGNGYSINIGDEAFRPPLLPFITSLLIKNGEWIIRLIFPVFGILGTLATYFLAKKLYDKKTALVSAFLVSASQFYIFYGQKILTETMSLTLFTMSFYFFHKSFRDRKYLMPTAVFVALSLLIRYTNGLFFVIFLIYFIYEKRFDLFKSKEFLISVVLFFLILSP